MKTPKEPEARKVSGSEPPPFFRFDLAKEEVEFCDRDGNVIGRLCVRQATNGIDVRRERLEIDAAIVNKAEAEALGRPLTADELNRQFFRKNLYPKLAACSEVLEPDGYVIPAADECYQWPSTEMNKWYAACERANPNWFAPFRQITDEFVKFLEKTPEGRQTLKKKEKKRGV